MKKFGKILSLGIVLALLCSFVCAYGAVMGENETDDAELKNFDVLECTVVANTVTITGRVEDGGINTVTFRITEDNTNSMLAVYQTKTDEEGVFSVRFTLKSERYDETGDNDATIRVGGLGINTYKTEGAELYSVAEMEQCKTAFVEIDGGDSFAEFFENYSGMLGIEEAYTEEQTEILYSYYTPVEVDDLQMIISEISKLVDKLNRHEALVAGVSGAAINGDGQEIKRLLTAETYADVRGFDIDTSMILNENDMWARMCNDEGYESIEEIQAAYEAAYDAQFEADKETGGVIGGERKYNFNNNWKVSSVANLITVKGSHELETKTVLTLHVAGIESGVTDGAEDTIMVTQTLTEKDGTFELVFPLNTVRFGENKTAMIRIGAPDTNITQFFIPLYQSEEVEKMIGDFKGLDDKEDLADFVSEYGKMLELGSGFDDRKLEIMYELYSEMDYSGISDADSVVEEIVVLSDKTVLVQNFIDDVNGAKQWGKIESAILTTHKNNLSGMSKHYDELYDNVTEYEKNLRDTYIKGMFGALLDKEYKNIQEITDALEDAYEEQKKKQTDADKKTPGGGGGSGGGGSSMGFGKDIVVEDLTQDTYLDPEKLPVEPFRDMEGYDWAKTSVDGLRKVGIIKGDGDGNYRPGATMTREEFLSVLLKTFGIEIESGNAPFGDVDGNAWYADTVATAYKLGITKGMGNGKFGIGENIKRADMAVMTARLAEAQGVVFPQVEEARVFEDYSIIPDYAYESVVMLQQADFINGDDKGCFNPMNNTTRAEAATFFWAVYNVVK